MSMGVRQMISDADGPSIAGLSQRYRETAACWDRPYASTFPGTMGLLLELLLFDLNMK